MESTINQILIKNEWKKVQFTKKAFSLFLSNDDIKIDPQFMITTKADPNYLSRKVKFQSYAEPDQIRDLEKIAKLKGCKISVVYFQAFYDFCVLCLSQN